MERRFVWKTCDSVSLCRKEYATSSKLSTVFFLSFEKQEQGRWIRIKLLMLWQMPLQKNLLHKIVLQSSKKTKLTRKEAT